MRSYLYQYETGTRRTTPKTVDKALVTESTAVENRRTLDQLAAAFNTVADEDPGRSDRPRNAPS
jgi:glycine cleavage system protein P-like pyridoxal-binding family